SPDSAKTPSSRASPGNACGTSSEREGGAPRLNRPDASKTPAGSSGSDGGTWACGGARSFHNAYAMTMPNSAQAAKVATSDRARQPRDGVVDGPLASIGVMREGQTRDTVGRRNAPRRRRSVHVPPV